jgi:error-prone DNA polymerase
MEFIHLHVASNYSIRYGANHPPYLVEAAVEQPALALTDRDGLFGAIKFVQAAVAAGVKPILGLELPLLETKSVRTVTPRFGGEFRDLNPARIVILGKGRDGFTALNRLASATAELGGITPEVLAEVIEISNAELALLLGQNSDVGRAFGLGKLSQAAGFLNTWRNSGARVYGELVSHQSRDTRSTPNSNSSNFRINYSTPAAARLWKFFDANQIPAVLTNAVRYVDRKNAKTIDILDATRRLVTVSEKSVDRVNAEGYLKSADEMWQVLNEISYTANFGIAATSQVWQNTNQLGMEFVIDPVADLGIGKVFVPELDVILQSKPTARFDLTWNRPKSKYRDDETIKAEAAQADAVLRSRCEAAMSAPKFSTGLTETEVSERLEAELSVISKLGFASYFLTVAEVVNLSKARGIRVAARGSGAGSYVNHLLGISALNPLNHGLVMERFLSPLRSSLPDIDIDVESHRRLEIYEAVLDRFGTDRVAAVSMMDTYRVRHAIRDVGKALAMPAAEIGIIAKAFPRVRARDIRRALTDLPELSGSGLGTLHKNGKLNHFIELVESLDALPRNVAMHPCGVLLSDSSLLDRTPVQSSGAEIPMSHFDKDDVETMGFLKLDILGIRMQSAMSHAVSEIARTEGVQVKLDELDLADDETFKLIQSTKTLGCFQIESPGQRELVGKFAPSTFNDIIIDISLFRPGPIKSDMITPFLNAKHGWNPPEYLHPRLVSILQETSGVVVFHEQVIKLVAEITGCSLAEADEVRRSLGDWDKHREIRGWFYPAGIKNGFDIDVVDEIWAILRAFGSFGFCKAHAGAFALPTYQSAWLKTHYPAAFYAGILTHDPGMYPKRLILQDARHFQVPIAPIDVNESTDEYVVEEIDGVLGLRLPLSELKGISFEEVNSIIQSAPFRSINDLWERSEISKTTLERLVLVGALDEIHGIDPRNPCAGRPTRRDLLVHASDLEKFRSRKVLLDEMLFIDELPVQPIPTGLAELNENEILQAELDLLGMDVSSHVLESFEPLLKILNVTRANQLLERRNNSEIFVVGVKVATQMPPIRSGKRVVFLTLDDSTGPLDVAFFEDTQEVFSSQLFNSWLLLVRGVTRRTGPKGISIRGTGCWDLNQVREIYEAGAGVDFRSDQLAGIEAVNQFIQTPIDFVEPIQNSRKLWHTSPGSPG